MIFCNKTNFGFVFFLPLFSAWGFCVLFYQQQHATITIFSFSPHYTPWTYCIPLSHNFDHDIRIFDLQQQNNFQNFFSHGVCSIAYRLTTPSSVLHAHIMHNIQSPPQHSLPWSPCFGLFFDDMCHSSRQPHIPPPPLLCALTTPRHIVLYQIDNHSCYRPSLHPTWRPDQQTTTTTTPTHAHMPPQPPYALYNNPPHPINRLSTRNTHHLRITIGPIISFTPHTVQKTTMTKTNDNPHITTINNTTLLVQTTTNNNTTTHHSYLIQQ